MTDATAALAAAARDAAARATDETAQHFLDALARSAESFTPHPRYVLAHSNLAYIADRVAAASPAYRPLADSAYALLATVRRTR